MGRRTILRTSFYNELRRPGVVARFLWDEITVGPSNTRWTVLSSGVCDAGRIDFTALLDSPAGAEIEGLTEYFEVSPAAPVRANRPWPLSEVWARISTEAVIPYDLDRRKERYRDAYESMHPMIEYYEELTREESNSQNTVPLERAGSDAD